MALSAARAFPSWRRVIEARRVMAFAHAERLLSFLMPKAKCERMLDRRRKIHTRVDKAPNRT